MIAIAEVKGVTPQADPHSGHGHAMGYAAGPQAQPTHLETGVTASSGGTSGEPAHVPATSEHPDEPIRANPESGSGSGSRKRKK